MGLEILHANRKSRVWRTISRVPRLLHGFYVEFRSWSVEGRGSWSFGTLQLSFHQLGKSLGSSSALVHPFWAYSFQVAGNRESGSHNVMGMRGQVMPWDSHFGSWTWYQLSSVLGHTKSANVSFWATGCWHIFCMISGSSWRSWQRHCGEYTKFSCRKHSWIIEDHLLQIVASLLLFPTFKHTTQ